MCYGRVGRGCCWRRKAELIQAVAGGGVGLLLDVYRQRGVGLLLEKEKQRRFRLLLGEGRAESGWAVVGGG
jgi:hypothetical protein